MHAVPIFEAKLQTDSDILVEVKYILYCCNTLQILNTTPKDYTLSRGQLESRRGHPAERHNLGLSPYC